MHKPSVSIKSLGLHAALMSIMAQAGDYFVSPGWFFRGGTKKSYRISPSIYTPRPAGVRNPKIAAQMNAMHDRWFAAKFHSKPASPT